MKMTSIIKHLMFTIIVGHPKLMTLHNTNSIYNDLKLAITMSKGAS